MGNGFRDPLAGIGSFAPEFWRLVAKSSVAPPLTTVGERAATVSPETPDAYPPFTDLFAPEPEQPGEMSPEDMRRQYYWDLLGELPLYRGDPPSAERLPPAIGDDIKVAPPKPNSNDVPNILENMTKLRGRISRAEEFQRKGVRDPKLDGEIAEMRKKLEEWQKALAARAQRAI